MFNPDAFSSFYTTQKLGFDLKLVEKGYFTFQSFFQGSFCLELGPATGYMTKFLVNSFEKVTVVEGSRILLDQIPDYKNIIKVHSLFENFKPSGQYDTIIINHVLEHLQDPVTLLKSVYSWLSNDGVCIVGVPNAMSFHRLAAVRMGLLKSVYDLNSRDLELGHQRVYDLDLLKLHLSIAKFNIIHEGGIFLKFLSNAQIESFLDEKIIDAYFDLAEEFYYNSAEVFVIAKK